MFNKTREEVDHSEGTESAIFLLQVKRYIATKDLPNDDFIVIEGDVYLAEDYKNNPDEAESLSMEECERNELVEGYWATESVFMTREQANEYVQYRKHRYHVAGEDYRVYSISSWEDIWLGKLFFELKKTNLTMQEALDLFISVIKQEGNKNEKSIL